MSREKTALIIGGSRGIGKAISKRLSSDGFFVIINYRSNDKQAEDTLAEIKQSGGDGILSKFDITDRKETSKKLEEILEAYKIDSLVHSAGIKKDELLVFMDDNSWDSVINTNLTGFYNIAKPVLKSMMLNRYGRVVVISSTSGESGLPGQFNYSASKAGIIGAVKSLAQEVAKRNILVNAVTPGLISTDMTDSENHKDMIKNIPLKRVGKPEEVAGAVSFLLSSDATYITGQTIRVNGGVYM